MGLYCTFIDGIPTFFGGETDPAGPPTDRPDGRLDEAVVEAVGRDRVRFGVWDGPYPLTGDELAASLAKCDEVAVLPAMLPFTKHHRERV